MIVYLIISYKQNLLWLYDLTISYKYNLLWLYDLIVAHKCNLWLYDLISTMDTQANSLTFEYVKNVSTGFSLLHFHSLVHSVQVELVILSYASANFNFKVQLICRTKNQWTWCTIKTDYTLKIHSCNVLTLISVYIFNKTRVLNFNSVTEIICRSFKNSYRLKVDTKSKFYQLYWKCAPTVTPWRSCSSEAGHLHNMIL